MEKMSEATTKNNGARIHDLGRARTESPGIVSPAIGKTFSPVTDADQVTAQALRDPRHAICMAWNTTVERHKAEQRNFMNHMDAIDARLRAYERPECFGEFTHTLQAGNSGQCDACDHVVSCVQAERGRS